MKVWRIAGAILSLLLWATGCRTRTWTPTQPGVSRQLAYPVLLIGQRSVDLRESEAALISIPGASSLNLNERVILDSRGRLFRVQRAAPVAGQESIVWSMGTKRRQFRAELDRPTQPEWARIQELVEEEVRDAGGDALNRVRQLRNLDELMAWARQQ